MVLPQRPLHVADSTADSTARPRRSLACLLPRSLQVSVPYSTNAGRNRVRNDPKRIPPPFKSTLSFDMGPFNRSRHPYRTLASAAMAPSEIPMHERLGFANPAVAEDIAKRLHKRVLDA